MNKVLKRILVIASLVIVILAILYFVFFMNPNIKEKNNKIKYNEYTIYNNKGYLDNYDKSLYVEGYNGDYDKAYYITGKLTSEKDSDFVVVIFNLYDKDDKIISTAVAGINDVKKNKEYSFKAMSLCDSKTALNVSYYKIKSING